MALRWSWLVLLALAAAAGTLFLDSWSGHAEFDPPYHFPQVENVELDANATPEVHGITTHFGGPLAVFVGPGDTPRILHLTSQEVADWRVYLLPGSRVERIYVSGFAAHGLHVVKAIGMPDNRKPEVIDLGLNLVGHETLSFGPPTSQNHRSFADYQDEIAAVIGHRLTHFQGARFLRPFAAFTIGLEPGDTARLAEHFPPAETDPAAADAEAELGDALVDLEGLIRTGKLPAQLTDFSAELSPPPGQLTFWSPIDAGPYGHAPGSSLRREKTCGTAELGSSVSDVFYCGTGYGDRSTRFVFAGGGPDVISDRYELSQVLSGGPGDDVIEADLGNDVVFVSAGWGHDVVSFRCGGGDVERAQDDDLGWSEFTGTPAHQRSRYVVFGRGINPRDLVWADGRRLTHPPSGSSIHFASGACATLVAVEPGTVPPSPEGTSAGY